MCWWCQEYAQIFFDLSFSLSTSTHQQHLSLDLPFVCMHVCVCVFSPMHKQCALLLQADKWTPCLFLLRGKQTGIYSCAPLSPVLSLPLVPLISDTFRQTQSYSRASYSNELIFHPGEVAWVRTDEDKWPSEGLCCHVANSMLLACHVTKG